MENKIQNKQLDEISSVLSQAANKVLEKQTKCKHCVFSEKNHYLEKHKFEKELEDGI